MIGTPRNIRRSSVSFRERQPLLTPRMRSIILYWLMKVVGGGGGGGCEIRIFSNIKAALNVIFSVCS